jgi:hypothetical protein
MKKFIIVFALFIGVVVCYGQDEAQNLYKPDAKKWTAEINFNPFASSPVSIAYLRARTFLTKTDALRLGLGLGYKDKTPGKGEKATSYEFNIRPGYEKHFAGTERLSPYVGFDIDFAYKTSSYSTENNFGSGPFKKIDGAWDAYGTEIGYTRIGANVLVGADYYFAKKMYVGVEFGLGFQNIKYTSVKADYFGGGTLQQDETSLIQLGPNYNSTLRLGFVF